MLRHCLNFSKNHQLFANPNFLSCQFQGTTLRSYAFGLKAQKAADDAYTVVSECEGIRVITLNKRITCHALSMAMMESILKPLADGWCDKNLRCIVLSSIGPIWSAGHDLKELAAASKSKQGAILDKLTEIILHIREAPVPVIASVDGLAAAAGCQLASSCDIVVASDKSSFSTPGSKFGVFCTTPGVALTRAMMPRTKAAYMLMTGLPITAAEALEAGLVTRVVPQKNLDDEVGKIIREIKNQSRAVIAHGKQFFYQQLSMTDLKETYECAANHVVDNLAMTDGKEGMQSFVEKRKPEWKHE